MKDINSEHINKALEQHLKIITKQQNEIFEEALRINAIPPIKGEITKGKLRCRGIRLIYKHELFKTETWLEQRGVRISQKFVIKGFIN